MKTNFVFMLVLMIILGYLKTSISTRGMSSSPLNWFKFRIALQENLPSFGRFFYLYPFHRLWNLSTIHSTASTSLKQYSRITVIPRRANPWPNVQHANPPMSSSLKKSIPEKEERFIASGKPSSSLSSSWSVLQWRPMSSRSSPQSSEVFPLMYFH